MLLKGALIGAGICVTLVGVFAYLVSRHLHAIVGPGPISFDLRYPTRSYPISQAMSFFGGLGIGFLVTMTCVVGAVYAFGRYAQHAAGLR